MDKILEKYDMTELEKEKIELAKKNIIDIDKILAENSLEMIFTTGLTYAYELRNFSVLHLQVFFHEVCIFHRMKTVKRGLNMWYEAQAEMKVDFIKYLISCGVIKLRNEQKINEHIL